MDPAAVAEAGLLGLPPEAELPQQKACCPHEVGVRAPLPPGAIAARSPRSPGVPLSPCAVHTDSPPSRCASLPLFCSHRLPHAPRCGLSSVCCSHRLPSTHSPGVSLPCSVHTNSHTLFPVCSHRLPTLPWCGLSSVCCSPTPSSPGVSLFPVLFTPTPHSPGVASPPCAVSHRELSALLLTLSSCLSSSLQARGLPSLLLGSSLHSVSSAVFASSWPLPVSLLNLQNHALKSQPWPRQLRAFSAGLSFFCSSVWLLTWLPERYTWARPPPASSSCFVHDSCSINMLCFLSSSARSLPLSLPFSI